ncbi:MAG: Ig-like domain-containing protein [Myxococcales bacterium]|nr:Ig-like domain-containing protein [Myxococcales bacterium]
MQVLAPLSVLGQGAGCLDEGPTLETTPGSGATEVALDAPVVVRFRDPVVPAVLNGGELSVLLLPEPVDVRPSGGGTVDNLVARPVAGRLQRLSAHAMAFVPADRLLPERDYFLTVEVFGAAQEYESDFRTGRRTDQQAPMLFIEEDDVGLVSGPSPAGCGLPDGSYLVDLDLGAAVDDADNGALEYYLFLTRARGLSAPILLDRVRRGGASGRVVLRFVLTSEQVEEPVCVAVRVVDGVGRSSTSEPEFCFDPRQSTYFHPLCRVSAPGARSRAGLQASPWVLTSTAFLVLLTLTWLARRSRAT